MCVSNKHLSKIIKTKTKFSGFSNFSSNILAIAEVHTLRQIKNKKILNHLTIFVKCKK
jgi:hypothetical protein